LGWNLRGKIRSGKKEKERKNPKKSPKKRKVTGLIGENIGGTF
jgi:hypothetical protein